MGNILIVDLGMDCIYCFNICNGVFVGKIVLDEFFVSIGINSDGYVVVCYQDFEFCLKILFYRF